MRAMASQVLAFNMYEDYREAVSASAFANSISPRLDLAIDAYHMADAMLKARER